MAYSGQKLRRSGAFVLADVSLVVAATFMALIVREDFELVASRAVALLPYLSISAMVALALIPAFGMQRTIWRYADLHDLLKIVLFAGAIVTVSMASTFAINRLDGVSRSIPILQGVFIVALLCASRVLARLRHINRAKPSQLAVPAALVRRQHVLVIGFGRLLELYLRSAAEHASSNFKIEGILGRSERDTGRLIDGIPVLGAPEDIFNILARYEIHGVAIDRIVVATPSNRLSKTAHEALMRVKTNGIIVVEHLIDNLGFSPGHPQHPMMSLAITKRAVPQLGEPYQPNATPIAMAADDLAQMAKRPYWKLKRIVDVVGASLLILLSLPLQPFIALLVALDVGMPVLFWQQRPGVGGYPFYVYKFRTMGPSQNRQGHRLPDHLRVSAIGKFLRRTRLDEFPQLYNILKGDMSFIGPRPLLPVDQPTTDMSRLLIRPGLTGWAQVSGGRDITPEEKAYLDLWYLRNASIEVDLKICLKTLGVLLKGEHRNMRAIDLARAEFQTMAASSMHASLGGGSFVNANSAG